MVKRKEAQALPGQVVLVLQGGGALGAYQLGVYQAMHEAGVEPDWVIGTSIGALNGAIIAGNPPEMRLKRLRQFWETMEQHSALSPETPIGVWQGQFTKLRAPNLYNLRADPFERGTESIYYSDWSVHRSFAFVPAQAIVARYLESFKEFPPRAKAASFTVGDAMEKIATASPNQN